MAVKLHDLDSRSEVLRSMLGRLAEERAREFVERIDMPWIYHDHALEGVVVSYQELAAGLGKAPVTDASSIPVVNEIQAYKRAIDHVREMAVKKKFSFTLDTIKRLYCFVANDEAGKTAVYRKDNPLHRLYFHEIAPPEKISYQMRKLIEWMVSDEARRLHPVKLAAMTHFKLIGIYPYQNHSGKVARLAMNLLLLRSGYQPAIIHAIERQRYYESLRTPQGGLLELVNESLENSMDGALRFFAETDGEAEPEAEAEAATRRRAS